MAVGSVRKLLKGGLSPAHIWSTVVLGVLLGMIPDYAASAGLVALLVLCSLLIRVNAGLFAVALIVSKTFLLLSLPWLFDLGQAALHGSMGVGLMTLSQLPVLAWFGFERYLCRKWHYAESGCSLMEVCPHQYPAHAPKCNGRRTDLGLWQVHKQVRKKPLYKGLCKASRVSPDFSLARVRNHPLSLSAAITSSTIASAFSRSWSPVAS